MIKQGHTHTHTHRHTHTQTHTRTLQLGRTAELARTFGITFASVLERGSQFRVESLMLRLSHASNYLAIAASNEQVSISHSTSAMPAAVVCCMYLVFCVPCQTQQRLMLRLSHASNYLAIAASNEQVSLYCIIIFAMPAVCCVYLMFCLPRQTQQHLMLRLSHASNNLAIAASNEQVSLYCMQHHLSPSRNRTEWNFLRSQMYGKRAWPISLLTPATSN